MKKLGFILIATLLTSPVFAQNAGKDIYVGGGIGINELDFFDNAIGFQFFAGMPININNDKMKLFAEVGYMDTGDFEIAGFNFGSISGLWATGHVEYALSPSMDLMGRIGLDFGDDDGVMFGPGISMAMGARSDLRIEYIIRDNVDSLQANFTFRL